MNHSDFMRSDASAILSGACYIQPSPQRQRRSTGTSCLPPEPNSNCTGFSEHSERALNYAVLASVEYDAERSLLHVGEHIKSAKPEKLIATYTERLDKLVTGGKRKTLKVKTGGAHREAV